MIKKKNNNNNNSSRSQQLISILIRNKMSCFLVLNTFSLSLTLCWAVNGILISVFKCEFLFLISDVVDACNLIVKYFSLFSDLIAAYLMYLIYVLYKNYWMPIKFSNRMNVVSVASNEMWIYLIKRCNSMKISLLIFGTNQWKRHQQINIFFFVYLTISMDSKSQ